MTATTSSRVCPHDCAQNPKSTVHVWCHGWPIRVNYTTLRAWQAKKFFQSRWALFRRQDISKVGGALSGFLQRWGTKYFWNCASIECWWLCDINMTSSPPMKLYPLQCGEVIVNTCWQTVHRPGYQVAVCRYTTQRHRADLVKLKGRWAGYTFFSCFRKVIFFLVLSRLIFKRR